MKSARSSLKYFFAALVTVVFLFSSSQATIPAGYKGKPYPPGSEPHEIPGRVNFHDYDYVPPSLGGSNGVTFVQDDLAGSANSNAGGRDGKIPGIPFDSCNAWPALYLTWHVPSSDTFYAAGVVYPNGARFPSPDTSVNDWYIGASHPNGMTKYTVHVPMAGKYWISSIWAADSWPIKYHINFFNGTATVSTPTVTINGSGSYHAWRKYCDFASIQLDSGVQVMQFQNETFHLNQDFLYIAADSGQFATAISRIPEKPTSGGPLDISLAQKTVRFSTPDAGNVLLSVYDCSGHRLSEQCLVNLGKGYHSVPLQTSLLRSGVYLLRLGRNGSEVVKKFGLYE
jgi:hypothetical protein